ncbi:hypothetical protein ACH5RR_006633 [Cinchona calisaya]|uniref:Uncharacterized protein n=1 Tax=Cinchona calisaya TaxID=153742 RepID=A0ABD3APV0_9GENT
MGKQGTGMQEERKRMDAKFRVGVGRVGMGCGGGSGDVGRDVDYKKVLGEKGDGDAGVRGVRVHGKRKEWCGGGSGKIWPRGGYGGMEGGVWTGGEREEGGGWTVGGMEKDDYGRLVVEREHVGGGSWRRKERWVAAVEWENSGW